MGRARRWSERGRQPPNHPRAGLCFEMRCVQPQLCADLTAGAHFGFVGELGRKRRYADDQDKEGERSREQAAQCVFLRVSRPCAAHISASSPHSQHGVRQEPD